MRSCCPLLFANRVSTIFLEQYIKASRDETPRGWLGARRTLGSGEGRAEDVRLGRVGAQVDVVDGDEVGSVVALAELEGRLAGDLVVVVAEEGGGGREADAEQSESGGELHRGGSLRVGCLGGRWRRGRYGCVKDGGGHRRNVFEMAASIKRWWTMLRVLAEPWLG